MNATRFNGPECERAVKLLDSYLDRQLPGDAVAELEQHVQQCPACARELAVRRTMRTQLQTAVRSISAPPELQVKIRMAIRESVSPRSAWLWGRLVPVGTAAMIALGLLIAYQLGHLRLTTRSQESYIASISTRVAALMRVGLGDHIHCAVFRKFPKNAPTAEEMTKKLGPQYAELISVVKNHVPGEYRLVMAHQCRYHTRRFVHLTLMGDSKLISLVIARKGDGESFDAQSLIPALTQSGIPFYRAGVQRFQMTAFETRDYLAYVVSDLSQQQNLDIMLALAPGVQEVLHKLEG